MDSKIPSSTEYPRKQTVMTPMNDPLVSICCITYNQEKYIGDTIDGFLMQRTNFPFEIIVHDDASTDGTAEIVGKYATQYPDIIRPILQKENQWSKGIYASPTYVWPQAKGKYIALCEGDDYWTDPLKLQKQVDFLESHPSYVLVSSNIRCVDADRNEVTDSPVSNNQRLNSHIKDISFFDMLVCNCVYTLTVCVRKKPLLAVAMNRPDYAFDYWYWLQLCSVGNFYKLADVTATYRIHSQGVSHVKNFFSRRWPLAKRDGLVAFFSKNKIKYASFMNRKAVASTLIRLLLNGEITLNEKKVLTTILFKNSWYLFMPAAAFLAHSAVSLCLRALHFGHAAK
jgi:glycosyltransferase involved in cell wall biosynthesis